MRVQAALLKAVEQRLAEYQAVQVVIVHDQSHVRPRELAEHVTEHLAQTTLAVGEPSERRKLRLVREAAAVAQTCTHATSRTRFSTSIVADALRATDQ